jgi:hypothetical protein
MPWYRSVTLTLVLPILAIWLVVECVSTWREGRATGDPSARHSTLGEVHLRLKLPGTHAGIPEPLIVCGAAGHASLVFIRLLNHARAKVGIEFWGIESDESDEFALPAADAEIDLTCYLPCLFPKPGHAYWKGIAQEIQPPRPGEFLILVNGVPRLQGKIDYPQPEHSALYFGENPLGGSTVSGRFTGTILQARQGNRPIP